jgi:hypothetical protein
MSIYCQGRQCPDCLGTGEVVDNAGTRQCRTCGGVGLTPCGFDALQAKVNLLLELWYRRRDPMPILTWMTVAITGLIIALAAHLILSR